MEAAQRADKLEEKQTTAEISMKISSEEDTMQQTVSCKGDQSTMESPFKNK